MQTSYAELLRSNRQFRLLWAGEIVSHLGDWFSLLALYAAVQEVTDSKLGIAIVLICKMLPAFLMAPIAGPLVDRISRRRILIGTDVARALLVLGLILAHRLHNLPLLYGLLALQMCFSGIFVPARTAVIGQITTTAELPAAMALSGGTWSIMLAVGAVSGGAVTQWIGIDGALIIDGLTYLVSAAILLGLPALPPGGRPGSDRSFAAGLRYLRRSPGALLLMTVKPGMALQSAALAMLPFYGNGTFPSFAGPLWVGVLYSARGIGATLGSVGTRRFTGDAPSALTRAIPVGLLAAAGSMALVAWSPAFWIATVGVFCAAVGTGTAWVFSGTLLQQRTPDEFRGRVFALEWGVMTLLSSVGSLTAGMSGDLGGFNERDIVAGLAIYMAVFAVLWSLVAIRVYRVRRVIVGTDESV